jgi:hypothetical protein
MIEVIESTMTSKFSEYLIDEDGEQKKITCQIYYYTDICSCDGSLHCAMQCRAIDSDGNNYKLLIHDDRLNHGYCGADDCNICDNFELDDINYDKPEVIKI